jgi:hypothetical protein
MEYFEYERRTRDQSDPKSRPYAGEEHHGERVAQSEVVIGVAVTCLDQGAVHLLIDAGNGEIAVELRYNAPVNWRAIEREPSRVLRHAARLSHLKTPAVEKALGQSARAASVRLRTYMPQPLACQVAASATSAFQAGICPPSNTCKPNR